MAVPLEKLENHLYCSICLDIYTNPKQLPCHHVYCQECLAKIVLRDQQGLLTLICPKCRQVMPVPASGVADLQPAFRVNQLLESVGVDSLSAHLDSVSINPTPHGNSTDVCPEHGGREVELYCETCEEAICWKCAITGGKHHSHNYKELDVSSKLAAENEKLEARLVALTAELSLAKESLRESEEKLEQLQTQWVVERREIQLTGPELGRGGWATVSVATFRGARVAAKCIHNRIISDYTISLVHREMSMAARIRHPNLLQFIGATQHGELIILTELMATSLRKELESRPKHNRLSRQQVTSIGADVARALNYLHLMQPQPLVHRDISSANVLLQPLPNDTWIAKVSDFTTVNFLKQLQTAAPGNPTYASPEANDPSEQSPKMDIFSFGVLLLEMLTGEFPDPDDRVRQILKFFPHPLLNPILKCLKRKKEDRPSAGDIIAELAELAELGTSI